MTYFYLLDEHEWIRSSSSAFECKSRHCKGVVGVIFGTINHASMPAEQTGLKFKNFLAAADGSMGCLSAAAGGEAFAK